MKTILILGMIMSLFGCAITTSDYYYASLENVDGVKVVSKRKLQLDKLTKNSKIPTEYLIRREEYLLKFLIGDKSYSPHFKVSVKGSGNAKFTLKPRRDIKTVSEEGIICSSYYLDKNNRSKMGFGWSTGCLSDDIKKEISFDVVDSSENIIASEDIPFVLVRDGKYTSLDAI
jgi:hypothetical protein